MMVGLNAGVIARFRPSRSAYGRTGDGCSSRYMNNDLGRLSLSRRRTRTGHFRAFSLIQLIEDLFHLLRRDLELFKFVIWHLEELTVYASEDCH